MLLKAVWANSGSMMINARYTAVEEMELIDALVMQLDVLERRHGLVPDAATLLACAELGLIPESADESCLTLLGDAGWHQFLYTMACRDPGLAVVVAASNRGAMMGTEVLPLHWAYHTQKTRSGWTVESACAPDAGDHFVFTDKGKLRLAAMCDAEPKRRSGERVLTWCISVSDERSLNFSADMIRPAATDLLTIRNGALSYAWQQAFFHANERPMFNRKLSDFPHIRLRLVQMYAMLRVIDMLTGMACGLGSERLDPDAVRSTLDALVSRVRDELQQIGGGTGYMAETPLGAAVQWLDWCDSAMWHEGGQSGLDPAVFAAVRAQLRHLPLHSTLIPPAACDQLLDTLSL